MRMKWVKWWRV